MIHLRPIFVTVLMYCALLHLLCCVDPVLMSDTTSMYRTGQQIGNGKCRMSAIHCHGWTLSLLSCFLSV